MEITVAISHQSSSCSTGSEPRRPRGPTLLLYDPPNTVHIPTHVPIVGKGQRETGRCFLYSIFWKLYTSFLLTSRWPELSDMVTMRVYYKQPCVWLDIPLSCMKKRMRLRGQLAVCLYYTCLLQIYRHLKCHVPKTQLLVLPKPAPLQLSHLS